MQAQLAAKRAVVAVTWTQASVRDLTAMERSISYTLQKVGRPRITLKSEQKECIEHTYEGKDVIVWLPTGFGQSLFPKVLSLLTKKACGGKPESTMSWCSHPVYEYVVHVGRRLNYAHARTVRTRLFFLPPQRAWVRC